MNKQKQNKTTKNINKTQAKQQQTKKRQTQTVINKQKHKNK